MASATERRLVPEARPWLAWAGVLIGPGAWFAELFGNWILGEVIACAPANQPAGQLFGRSLDVTVTAFDVVLLALTVLAGVGSFLELRRIRSGSDPTPGGRASWLAGAGVMTSLLFTALIVVTFVPTALIRSCS